MALSQRNTFPVDMDVKSANFLNLLNEIGTVCANVQKMQGYSDTGIVIDKPDVPAGTILDVFPARLTGNATLATDRFKYAWTEIEYDGTGTSDKANGRSGTTTTDFAINTVEINHTSVFQYGIDTSIASYTDTAIGIRPIGASGVAQTHDYDVIVDITERTDKNGDVIYTFQLMGTHDGLCS